MSEMNHQDHETNKNKSVRDNRYWLTLEQWGQDPEFQKLAETEFQSSPLREGSKDGSDGDVNARRDFLKLMGASLAMATAAGCRRPAQKIVPYNKQPEEVTFGVTNFYTSTWTDGSESLGLLVRTREGRPIKIDGNPQHPLTKGGTTARAQATILSLYDPERLQGPKKNLLNKEKTNRDTVSTTWDDADKAIVEQLKKGGVAVLTGNLTSPSMKALVSDFVQAFKGTHVSWEPVSNEELRDGQKASYGNSVLPFYRFDKAKVIVSVDADFLGTWLAPVTFSKQFAAGRRAVKSMSKMVAFDSNFSLTGANADIRVKIKPSQQVNVVMGLAHEIIVKKNQSKFAGNSSVKSALDPFANTAQELGMDAAVFSKLAEDLWKNQGTSLVVAGGMTTNTTQAQQLQIAVNFLNSALNNEGSTVLAGAAFQGSHTSSAELLELVESMNKGQVKTLIIHHTNPVYSLPKAVGFAKALQKVEMVIYTGDRNDETGLMSNYVLPDNHSMESWGDAELSESVFTIQQPTIRPMYDTRSVQLSMMTWAFTAQMGSQRLRGPETYYDFVRNYWKSDIHPKFGKGKSFEDFWSEALQVGWVGNEKLTENSSAARSFRLEALSTVKPAHDTGYEVALYPSLTVGDGTLANVPWLQEMPHPISKVVWDNYVSISLDTAAKLKVKQEQIIDIKIGDVKVSLPVHIQPGLHNDVLSIPVGYGRWAAGKVANGIGVNSYELATVEKGRLIFAGHKAEVTATSKKHDLAVLAGHHSMEGRKIVAEATLKDYMKNEEAGNHKHKIFSIWSGHQFNGHKWGMAVDLNTCTGCSACMIACQSENNIPVVGKKFVLQGREMHWMRVDRYFVGDPKNAQAVFQPVMCQQCDNAPCETVCPVLATVHSSEGLNDIVYNRCVGTRYCSNNCPYKVRRFNWFNYAKLIEKPMHMALNPDVTVRSRGVMEKCTFCVHRIKATKIAAKNEKRELKDGDVKTACQESCPSDAIMFGDLNDPNSKVSQAFNKDPRSYALLEEFNAAPSVRYMVKIRNNDQESAADSHHAGGHT